MIERILKRPGRSPGRGAGRRDRPSVEPPASLPVASADRATLVRAEGITKTFTQGGAAVVAEEGLLAGHGACCFPIGLSR